MEYKIFKNPGEYKEAAKDFIENEKQFQLGVIPTEQSNPITKNLSAAMARDTKEGISLILEADRYIAPAAAAAFETQNFKDLVADIRRVMDERRQFVFSSVGASGRMAITLDSAWRLLWTSMIDKIPAHRKEFLEISECSNSFTTGGDRALVRSVEDFEDFMTFGARQVQEAGMTKGDVMIGLSECGLSASINGSVIEADKRGCATYYLYCNPKETLCKYLERVRMVFARPNIKPISIFVGNMAVAGSTRMQVTTVELLTAGAALEIAANGWLKDNLTEDEYKTLGIVALEPDDYAVQFKKFHDELASGEALEGLAKLVEFEADTYRHNGLVTYLTHDYLLDIMTDTTERQPTFTLPPFRTYDDKKSAVSWAYVKDPLYPSTVAWQHVFRRPIKGLDWSVEDYRKMGATRQIIEHPPLVGSEQVERYNIGWEEDESRYGRKPANLIVMDINGSANAGVMAWYEKHLPLYGGGIAVRMGHIPEGGIAENEIRIPVDVPRTSTELFTHLMVKITFNLLSTAGMTKIGKIWSNWMIQVLPTNKKLIDRSIRIISELAHIDYQRAAEEFFISYLTRKPEDEYRESYAVETLKRLGFDPNADIV